jgi:FKBP-type peptidyl-prolyl cis-trans isomerase SlyD
MKVDNEKVVSLTYKLTVSGGDVVDTATEENPFVFIHGVGQTIPAFDENLKGLSAGDDFSFEIEAEDGYGTYQEENKVFIPREVFDVPGAPADLLEIGRSIPMQDNQGHSMYGVVTELHPDKILMDFNHPLAGQKLSFEGKIISVREATQEELAHGHVHGDGGVHH